MQYGVLIVALMLIVGYGVISTIVITEEDGIFESSYTDFSMLEKGYKYIVLQNDTHAFLMNGTNGKIISSNTDHSTIISLAISSLDSGRTYKQRILIKGDFTLESVINIPSYTIIDIDGILYQGTSNTGYMLYVVQNAMLVEINGGIIRGTKAIFGEGIYIHTNSASNLYGDPNVILKNIYVYNFSGVGIKDRGRKTYMENVFVVGCNQYGIRIYSGSDGTYMNCFVGHCGWDLWRVESNFNYFFKCTADHGYVGAVGNGFYVDSSYNIFVGGYSEWTNKNGFWINGNYNEINNMQIIDNELDGIVINGSYNKIISNSIWDDRDPYHQDTGIRETNNASYNIIAFNDVTRANTSIDVYHSGTKVFGNIAYNYTSLFPFYEQDSEPSVEDNSTVYWYDTDGNYLYQIVNTYGDTWYLNYTKTI